MSWFLWLLAALCLKSMLFSVWEIEHPRLRKATATTHAVAAVLNFGLFLAILIYGGVL